MTTPDTRPAPVWPAPDTPRPDSGTVALLLADSRLPVGAHVTSNGLEAALLDGLDPARVGDYLASRLHTVTAVEAGAAVVARHLALTTPPDQLPGAVEHLRTHWAARTPSRAQREIAVVLGDGLARLAAVLWPGIIDRATVPAPRTGRDGPAGPSRAPARGLPRALVLGLVAAAAGIDASALVRLVAYDDAQTVIAAQLKLEPSDPRLGAAQVLGACALLEPEVGALAALTDPAQLPSSGAPLTEHWAEAQATLPRRLFRA